MTQADHISSFTVIELRILYLLHRFGGSSALSILSQQMSRFERAEREAAFKSLEDCQLISSAITPPTNKAAASAKGRPPMKYWLTQSGKDEVAELMAKGVLGDPEKELRGNRHA